MFEGDSADMCAGKFPLVSMGGRAEGLACTDLGARTPIGASGNFHSNLKLPCIQIISCENLNSDVVIQIRDPHKCCLKGIE